MRGYQLRQIQAAESRAAARCGCGHTVGEHHELSRETMKIVDGQIVVTPNPDHRALHFHCDACDCVLVLS
jgi:hypothetical protein